jgi:hypothetical protein
MRKACLALIFSLGGIGFIFSAGCKKKRPQQRDPAENQLKHLRLDLKNYNGFGNETVQTLLQLSNLAHRTQGDVSTEAFYYLGRGYVDWLLTALARDDSRLMHLLFRQLRLNPQCCSLSEQCVEARRLALDDGCRLALHKKLKAIFAAMSRAEGPTGAYRELSEEFSTLISALVVHSKTHALEYYRLLGPLFDLRDPVGTRARLAVLIDLGDSLNQVSNKPPHEAALFLAQLMPFRCPQVFGQLSGLSSGDMLWQKLQKSRCRLRCNAVPDLPKTASGYTKKVLTHCTLDHLQFSNRKEKVYFSPLAYIAVRALQTLSLVAKGLSQELSDPVIKLHRRKVKQALSQITRLRVRLPYPATVKINDRWIEPPILAKTQPDCDIEAPVHVLVHGDVFYVGLLPVGGLHRHQPRFFDHLGGFLFPGKRVSAALPRRRFKALLRQARKTAAGFRRQRAAALQSDWVSLYADRKEKGVQLKSVFTRLRGAAISTVQLLFVPQQKTGGAQAAVTVHLKGGPKRARKIRLARLKTTGENSASTAASREKTQKTVPRQKVALPKGLLVTDWSGLPYRIMIEKLLHLKARYPSQPIHLRL